MINLTEKGKEKFLHEYYTVGDLNAFEYLQKLFKENLERLASVSDSNSLKKEVVKELNNLLADVKDILVINSFVFRMEVGNLDYSSDLVDYYITIKEKFFQKLNLGDIC